MEAYNSKESVLCSAAARGIDRSDFFIRLDLIGILASARKIHLGAMLQRSWADVFPRLPLTSDIEKSCLAYFDNDRFGYKLISSGDSIRSSMLMLKSLIPAAVILNLSCLETETVNLAALAVGASEMILDAVDDRSALFSRVDAILQDYFQDGTRLDPETLRLIRRNRPDVESVFDRLHDALRSRRSTARSGGMTGDIQRRRQSARVPAAGVSKGNVPSAYAPASGRSRFDTPMDYARVACLLFAALPKADDTRKTREESIREQWNRLFPKAAFTEQALNELNMFLESDRDLNAFNMLFRYSLKEIQNERIAHRIIVCLCVNQVLSRLPHNSPVDLVTDEAVSLFERFDILSLGKEEGDIERYLRRLGAGSGCVDEQITRLIWQYSEDIAFQFKKSVRDINSKDRVRRRYWEARLGEKDRQVSELQSQINTTRINTVYSIVEKMCSPEYDYMLSRLYRFAYQSDSLPEEQFRLLIKQFFQMLRFFGVRPTMEDIVGRPLSDVSEIGMDVIVEPISGMENNCVVFPGWNVSGDTVILPIACGNERRTEDEKIRN